MLRFAFVPLMLLLIWIALAFTLSGCAPGSSGYSASMDPDGAMRASEKSSTPWQIGESSVSMSRVTQADAAGTTTTTQTLDMQRTKSVIGALGAGAIGLAAGLMATGGAAAP